MFEYFYYFFLKIKCRTHSELINLIFFHDWIKYWFIFEWIRKNFQIKNLFFKINFFWTTQDVLGRVGSGSGSRKKNMLGLGREKKNWWVRVWVWVPKIQIQGYLGFFRLHYARGGFRGKIWVGHRASGKRKSRYLRYPVPYIFIYITCTLLYEFVFLYLDRYVLANSLYFSLFLFFYFRKLTVKALLSKAYSNISSCKSCASLKVGPLVGFRPCMLVTFLFLTASAVTFIFFLFW